MLLKQAVSKKASPAPWVWTEPSDSSNKENKETHV